MTKDCRSAGDNPSPDRSPDAAKRKVPARFHSLDALRGLAALAVVFWHWQHFFYIGDKPSPQFDRTQQPLYFLFAPFYNEGYRAVDLFFCLSGFIFFWLYGERIAKGSVNLRQFFALRFSRLYPLHLLTLLIVAAGQGVLRWQRGEYFVYPDNDGRHFVLQLMFASGWGLERGNSFNAPVWSVSVEVVCYVVFFVTALVRWRRWWHVVIFMAAGYFLSRLGVAAIGTGMFLFFLGGLVFQIFGALLRFNPPRYVVYLLVAATGLLWIAVPYQVESNGIYELYRKALGAHDFTILGKHPDAILLIMTPGLFEMVLFPVTILTLALWETQRGTLGRRLAFLGDLSYSSYLWHFPLQLLFHGIAFSMAMQSEFFRTPLSLFLFFTVLFPLSLWSHRYFERPCQSLIRQWAGAR